MAQSNDCVGASQIIIVIVTYLDRGRARAFQSCRENVAGTWNVDDQSNNVSMTVKYEYGRESNNVSMTVK